MIRSEISSTSSSLWVMKITAIPSRVSDLRIWKSSLASGGVRTAVGSSRIRMSALAVERLEDLDALLGADGEVLHERVRVDRELEALRELADALLGLVVVEQQTVACRLLAEHDVLGDRHDRNEHEVLVDHPDPAARSRRSASSIRTGFALDDDLALVRRVEAVEDVHQRRLAGAVLAEEGVHLAGKQVEVDSRRSRRCPGSAW